VIPGCEITGFSCHRCVKHPGFLNYHVYVAEAQGRIALNG
jgi:hypothetical protein